MLPLQGRGRRTSSRTSSPRTTRAARSCPIPTGGGPHTPTKLLQMPAERRGDRERLLLARPSTRSDGRFYISTTRLTGNDDTKEKLMLAYGK